MNAERWRRVDKIFHDLLERKPGERASFLDHACGDDPSLRREIEALIKSHEKTGSFPENRASGNATVRLQAGRGKGERADKGRVVLWGIYAVAASYVLYFGIVIYLDFAGPSLGMSAGFSRGYVSVEEVISHSPAEAAGFQAGDLIVRADGQLMASDADWFAILSNLKVGAPASFEVQRDSRRLNLVVTPARRQYGSERFSPLIVLFRIGQSIMLGFACFIAIARPRNGAALLGASLLGVLSISNPPQALTGYAALGRDLASLPLLWIAGLSTAVLPQLLFTFCATFPRKLIRSRWIWVLLWTPSLVALVPRTVFSYRVMWDPHHAAGIVPQWANSALSMIGIAYFLSGPLAMAVNYRRLADLNERRRVRVLVFGSVAGLLALVPLALLIGQPSFAGTPVGHVFRSAPVLTGSVVVVYIVFPLSFAYSILRHRVFDVRIIIRQGLQYAMARSALLSIVPLLAAFLVADLFMHGDQTLAATFKTRGWIYAFLGGLAVVVYQKREQWLHEIDHRFFRDCFHSQRLLQEVIQNVKEFKAVSDVEREVLPRVQRALHPEFVSLLLHEVGEDEFRPIASVPVHTRLRLPAGGKLMALLRVLGNPLQLSASAWVVDELADEEFQILEEQRMELIVPIRLGSDSAESLLVFGPKLSEEPYSRGDEKLLSAIAAGLALVSPGAAIAEADKQGFRECPDCGVCFSADASRCDRDGSDLTPVPLPRLLAQRYRLDRRLGSGGMGTVYSGTDQALERPIAIKVIRPDLAGDPGLTARFHREARAAAGIIHPNVVTIHDFGVERRQPFIVMELLTGRTLRTELNVTKRISTERTLEILHGVCAAVEEAHKRQLLHRDLKPENIFLVEMPTGDVVKVLDFGLAKVLPASTSPAESTLTATIAGTPYYMAPELLMGRTATRSSDIWALGVIAYEMLNGLHPFFTETANWQKVLLNASFKPVSEHGTKVSRQLQSFFERVFQLDPTQRIHSPETFQSLLELALKPESSQALTAG